MEGDSPAGGGEAQERPWSSQGARVVGEAPRGRAHRTSGRSLQGMSEVGASPEHVLRWKQGRGQGRPAGCALHAAEQPRPPEQEEPTWEPWGHLHSEGLTGKGSQGAAERWGTTVCAMMGKARGRNLGAGQGDEPRQLPRWGVVGGSPSFPAGPPRLWAASTWEPLPTVAADWTGKLGPGAPGKP